MSVRGGRRPVFQPSLTIFGCAMNSMKANAPSGFCASFGTTQS